MFTIVILSAGCSLEKKNWFDRNMQNLTAHYNILFNAKEILRLKQISYATSFVDNYNEILSVYQDTILQTAKADKDLEDAIIKANTIINIKEQSHYLGDAYLVLAKAYFLEGNYFNSVEYFNYVIRSFPDRLDLVQDALVWKARSLMYLSQLTQAKQAVESAIQTIQPKKRVPADIYATALQYDIDTQDYSDGEEMATNAIHYCTDIAQKLRWTFILAQVQELNQKPKDAYKNYSSIVKSNASFELSFNASLNRIRMEDNQTGVKISRADKLLTLLKDPNNKEFKDQIYYQVAEIKRIERDIDNAIKYYNLSVRYSIKNQNQKGLSYLRLAEIYFNNKADYLRSKKYYDSTLTTLPSNYPGYLAIQKKGNNLQLLAAQLLIIMRQDTLQNLAKMDSKTRMAAIDQMTKDKVAEDQAIANNAASNSVSMGDVYSNAGVSSTFYFYNSNAVSQGYVDFKQKWGNRKLEDDWRRSSRSSADVTNNSSNTFSANNPGAILNKAQANKNEIIGEHFKEALLEDIPVTPELLAQSNLSIYNAYIDMGGIYRDVLDDKKESIATFELMLQRFPNNTNNAVVYYSLYRLYSDLDPVKSDYYKNIIVKNYPETPFSKIIEDPDYFKKLDDKNAGLTQAYNVVFDLYAHKQYKEVIACVPELLKEYPGNKFAAQLYYLQTIAAGHNENLTPFRDSLQNILKKFPNDKLIDPLINEHLTYINANQTEMAARDTVLKDDDPKIVPFTLAQADKKQANFRKTITPYYQTATQQVAKSTDIKKTPLSNKPIINQTNSASSIFSMRDSTHYLFVINVSTGTTNLSSSRFGIGQFNRANYPGNGIKHELMPIGDDNQLIYVGRFLSYDGVKKYADGIVPLLPDIMKVPQNKYSFFIITQENLNKLADKKTLDSYLDYYQKNY